MGNANLKLAVLLGFSMVAVEKIIKPAYRGQNQKAFTMNTTTQQTQILLKKTTKTKENLVSLSINPLKVTPNVNTDIKEIAIKNAEYVFLKRLLIYTEGFSEKAYKDGKFSETVKGKQVWKQNWSVGFGSNAGIGKILIPSVRDKVEGWQLAERQLSDCMQKAKRDFPLLQKHQHYAVASLYYKAGIHIFELPSSDPKYNASMKIRGFFEKGVLPSKDVFTPLWVSMKNRVGNHKETRLLEISLLYRDIDNGRFQRDLVKLLNETK